MEGFSVVGALVKTAVIFVLLWITLKGIGRLHGQGGGVRPAGRARPVDVVGRSAVGRKASVVLVRMGTTCYALGVTDEHVTLIGEVDADLPEAPPAGTQATASGPSWREVVERLRERTVRH